MVHKFCNHLLFLTKLSSCLVLQLLPNSCYCWVVKQRETTLVTKICYILKYKINKREPNWPVVFIAGWGFKYLNLQNQLLWFWITKWYPDNGKCKFLFSPFGAASPVTPSALAELLNLLDRKTISSSAAKQVCPHFLKLLTARLFQEMFYMKSNAITKWIS